VVSPVSRVTKIDVAKIITTLLCHIDENRQEHKQKSKALKSESIPQKMITDITLL